MDRAVSFEEPQVLFDLPKPFTTSGRIQAGSSYNIFNQRKRKRADIAVGIDGHGLNLYSTKESRLVTTHALPPQSSFTAPPVFLHKKRVSNRYPARRFACAAVRSGAGQSGHELQCFEEVLELRTSGNVETAPSIIRATKSIGSSQDEPVFIDAIPVTRNIADGVPPFDVLAVMQSGHTIRVTGDLKTDLWAGNTLFGSDAAQGTTGSSVISYASLHDASSLCDGFLRAHPDLVATLRPAVADDGAILNETYVLLSISTAPADASLPYQLFVNLNVLTKPSSLNPNRTSLQHLVTWPLPAASATNDTDTKPAYNFNTKSGHLYVTSIDDVVVYDLGKTAPLEACRFHAEGGKFNSAVRTKGSLVAVSAERHFSVYDMQHRTLLARVETFRPDKSLKRKRNESSPLSSPLQIIRFTSGSGLLYGITNTQMVAMRINVRAPHSRSGNSYVGRLADSLGCAAVLARSHPAATGKHHHDESSKIITSLNGALADANTFDTLFDKQVVKNAELSNQAMQHISSFVICKVFAWIGQDSKKKFDSQPSLRVARMPRESFHWLTFKGHITPKNVEHALCQMTGAGTSLPTVTALDIVEALARYDQSLVLLSAWIELQPHPELDTFVHCLRRLLRSFDADETPAEPKLLTDGKDTVEGEDDQLVEDAESAAERDLEAASTLLEDGMQIRAAAIKTCLSRLSTSFQQSVLSRALKRHMAQRDLILLIDLLRVELSEDGWGNHFSGQLAGLEETSTPSDGLNGACSLLNGAVDALGSGGLLAGSYGAADEYDSAEAFLNALRDETSAVIEGIQEATFFSGFLKDFLRFEQTVVQTRHTKQKKKQAAGGADQSGILPMGLKDVKPVSATRIGAGGEIQKRTNRDIGHKQSKRAGQYTFESIQI